MYVIGTAGHVDHGKSSLVQALTGIDPDRLREEKERGLTIDLGFAWLTLPSGREVSIVDVPGHERFIKNMLAGAGGVDLALLVVAADEGPMPQTREHLAILELLDVPSAVVALTKADLVDDDYAALVEAETADALESTRFAGAPVVRTSAITKDGLNALMTTLDAALDGTAAKRDLGRPRLPIDRAFTIQGFGVVVTGTLLDGSLHVGQEVELQPGGRRARVRGLQRHKAQATELEPGTRAAVNLSGLRLEDVERGMVLALPGSIVPASVVDVRLRATSLAPHTIQDGAGVTFLSATAESEARLRLLDCEELVRGGEAWAQIVLDSPVAVLAGDRCVLRASNETIAGGAIVAINPRRHRRRHAATIAALERLLAGTPEQRLDDALATGPMSEAAAAEALQIDAGTAARLVADAVAEGRLRVVAGRLYGASWLAAAQGRGSAVVSEYLAANPLRDGVPREHVRSALRLDAGGFDVVVAAGMESGAWEERAAGLAPSSYEVRLTAAQEKSAEAFCGRLAAGGAAPPTDGLPEPALLTYLVQQNRVVDAGSGVYFAPAAYEEMSAKVRAHLSERGTITLAEARDLLGTSRKYAQALLEHLDSIHLTRRQGDVRALR